MNHQLDIFDDSRDQALRNDIAQAVQRADWQAARDGAAALQAEFGADAALEPANVLIEHLRDRAGAARAAFTDLAAVLQARRHLAETLAPAADRLLGHSDAAAWLATQWLGLAGRARSMPWQAEWHQAHAASLYLAAGDWAAAAQAVRDIPSWRRIPQPLLWMTEACWHLQGAAAGWPLLAEALWLAPGKAAALLECLPDPRLAVLARRFDAAFEPERDADWSWLPAWLPIEQPDLAAVLGSAGSDAELPSVRGFKLVLALLRLERAGRHHEIVEHRRQLRATNERLFATFMRTR